MMYFEKVVVDRIKMTKDRISTSIYSAVSELDMTIYKSPEPLKYEQRLSVESQNIKIGDKWGDV